MHYFLNSEILFPEPAQIRYVPTQAMYQNISWGQMQGSPNGAGTSRRRGGIIRNIGSGDNLGYMKNIFRCER